MNDHSGQDDFLLFHTYACHVMDQRTDPFEVAEFLVGQGLFNGIMIWVDHHKKTIHPPPMEWLRQHQLAILFEFYTNDHYTVPCAKMEGFGDDLAAYNEFWCDKILDYLHALGPNRSYWGLGHEHYDSFSGFAEMNSQGEVRVVIPETRRAGFETYKRWITTNAHQAHWGPHRYATLPGYRSGRMTDQSDTLAFLKSRNQSIPHGLVLGGVGPHHAHYQFEIFPEQEAFWWECMVPGLPNVQVGMSFLRGACRQYGRQGLADVAPYEGKRGYHPDLEQQKPLAQEFLNALSWSAYDRDGKKLAGFSENLHFRVWMSLWANGVDQMLHEDSISTHLLEFGKTKKLSPLGQTHATFADLSLRQAKDRGTVISPVAVVLPFLHGLCPQNAWMEGFRPWLGMTPTPGDWSIYRFFEAAFPNHGQTTAWPYPGNPWDKTDLTARAHYGRLVRSGADLRAVEPKHVTASRWGDGFDVILDNASLEILGEYPALVLLGDFDPDSPLIPRLKDYLIAGGRVLCTNSFPGLANLGIRPAINQDSPLMLEFPVGRGTLALITTVQLSADKPDEASTLPESVISVLNGFLAPLQVLDIAGPPLQWCASRNRQGLRLYLANHSPVDALPILTLHPGRQGLTISESAQVHDFITGRMLPIQTQGDQSMLEIFIPAWGCALLDIPAVPVK